MGGLAPNPAVGVSLAEPTARECAGQEASRRGCEGVPVRGVRGEKGGVYRRALTRRGAPVGLRYWWYRARIGRHHAVLYAMLSCAAWHVGTHFQSGWVPHYGLDGAIIGI